MHKDPKFGNQIERIAIIHLDPPSEFPGVGMGYRACNHDRVIGVDMVPGTRVPNPFNIGTGVASLVTCEACKKTPEYLALIARENDEDDDRPSMPSMTTAAMERLQPLARPA